MADYSGSYAYLNTLQAITREGFVTKSIVDTVFTSSRLMQELRNLTDSQNGALALTWPINIGKSSNTIAFAGGQALPANSLDTFIRASLPWKYYADALTLNVTDLQQNDSPEAIASLVDSQLDIVKMSLVDRLAGDIITSTQAAYPLQLNGLAEAVDDGTVASSYANISRTTYPTQWKGVVNYNVTSSGTAIIQSLYSLDLQASIDGHRPNLYATSRLNFAAVQNALYAQDRYNQPDLARSTGGYDLIFNGTPVIWDPHIQTGVVSPQTGSGSGGFFYGLNRSTIKFVIDPKMNFRTTDWLNSTTTAQVICRILFAGNLVVARPSSNFVAWISGG